MPGLPELADIRAFQMKLREGMTLAEELRLVRSASSGA